MIQPRLAAPARSPHPGRLPLWASAAWALVGLTLGCAGDGDTTPDCSVTTLLAADLGTETSLATDDWLVTDVCLTERIVDTDCSGDVSATPYRAVDIAREGATLTLTSYDDYPAAKLTLDRPAADTYGNERDATRELARCWARSVGRPCDRNCRVLGVPSAGAPLNGTALADWTCNHATAADFEAPDVDAALAADLFARAQTLFGCAEGSEPALGDFLLSPGKSVCVRWQVEGRDAVDPATDPLVVVESCSLASVPESRTHTVTLAADGQTLNGEWFAFWSEGAQCPAGVTVTGTFTASSHRIELRARTAHPASGGCYVAE